MPATLKRVELVALVLLFAALVTFPTLWSTAWHVKLDNMVHRWKLDGPANTMIGKLWDVLSAAWWLGPLRPKPPLDPLKYCGVLANRLTATRKHVRCLEERIKAAYHEHRTVRRRLLLGLLWLTYNNVHNIIMSLLRRKMRQAREDKATPDVKEGKEQKGDEKTVPTDSARTMTD